MKLFFHSLKWKKYARTGVSKLDTVPACVKTEVGRRFVVNSACYKFFSLLFTMISWSLTRWRYNNNNNNKPLFNLEFKIAREMHLKSRTQSSTNWTNLLKVVYNNEDIPACNTGSRNYVNMKVISTWRTTVKWIKGKAKTIPCYVSYFNNFANGSECKGLSAFTSKFPSSTAGLHLVSNTSCLRKKNMFSLLSYGRMFSCDNDQRETLAL